MGYTHYWEHQRDLTENEWQQIGKAFENLLALPEISLAGITGEGSPVFTSDYLAFNGVSPRAVEAFILYRTRSTWEKDRGIKTSRPWRGFCKTEHQPYDLAVMAILLLATPLC